MPNRRPLETHDQSAQAKILVPNAAGLEAAARALRQGGLVAFPTETVYGLGADAANAEAVAAIFAAKGRPQFNPLIVHVKNFDTAAAIGLFSEKARRLAGAFWPGPLTLVVKRREGIAISLLVSAGLDTIALRVPDHPIARALLETSSLAIAAPSANRSGHVSATRAGHVAADLGARVALILDGGPTAHGLESTVLDVTGNSVLMLRPGAVPLETIEAVLGETVGRANPVSAAPLSPGQLESHYAPNAPLRLNVTSPRPDEALLAFGPDVPQGARHVINLSARGDLIEAAANLFAALRSLDAGDAAAIAVMPVPNDGLGEAINDRLKRAAAPRS
jgi:L-threonylcarbamoyladenylate synthase